MARISIARTNMAQAGRTWLTAAFFALMLIPSLLAPSALFAQDINLNEVRTRLETIRAVFDYVESGITATSSRSELQRLRDSIEPLRGELQQKIGQLEPRFAEVETRLKTLGPAPAKDAPAEDPSIASERKQISTLQGEVDGLLKTARVLALRGEQLSTRVEDLRRSRLTDRLLERTFSILDPKLWLGTAEALPVEIRTGSGLVAEWFDAVRALPGATERVLVAVAAIVLIVAGIFLLQGWLRRKTTVGTAVPGGARLPKLRRTKAAARDALLNAAALPLAFYAAIEVLSAFDLLIDKGRSAATGLLAALILYSIGRALAGVLLRPNDGPRRLLEIGDDVATRFYNYSTYSLLIAASSGALNIIHRNIGAPRIMIMATSALMAGAIAVLIARMLMKTRRAAEEGAADPAPSWLRLVLWVIAILILGALATGHIWLASFLTSRLIHAAIVIAGCYVLIALIDAYFDEGMNPRSQRGRNFSSTVGVRPSALELAATLFAGVARVFVFIVAIFLIIGNWGTSLTDLASSFDHASFGIELGKLHISLYDIITAVGILVIGVFLARALQRWLANTVMPRTQIDPSLKNSIATIVGYIGVIAAISIALGRLGLNLENIALVAGALSVGIGFGLQAIVSNFVSGLILLTERPVKVGDLINVKGQDGYIRRISVRSTEVETFDRASVIIPNSEFITGVVTNWTHHNTLSRIKIPVAVPAGKDVEKVRDLLLKVAAEHPRVVREPGPKVMLLNIDGDTLGFELRCLIDSVAVATQTKSDLNFAILKALRTAGLRQVDFTPAEPAAEDKEDPAPDAEAPQLRSAESRTASKR